MRRLRAERNIHTLQYTLKRASRKKSEGFSVQQHRYPREENDKPDEQGEKRTHEDCSCHDILHHLRIGMHARFRHIDQPFHCRVEELQRKDDADNDTEKRLLHRRYLERECQYEHEERENHFYLKIMLMMESILQSAESMTKTPEKLLHTK